MNKQEYRAHVKKDLENCFLELLLSLTIAGAVKNAGGECIKEMFEGMIRFCISSIKDDSEEYHANMIAKGKFPADIIQKVNAELQDLITEVGEDIQKRFLERIDGMDIRGKEDVS